MGKRRWATKEEVLHGLRIAIAEIPGKLPSSDRAYHPVKKGHLDWPSCTKIYEYFGNMASGWLAAGARRTRVNMKFAKWSVRDDNYLKLHAGIDTLAAIAKKLRRTYQAVRCRLSKGLKIHARSNRGYFSAAELAKEFNCSYHRIRLALNAGDIIARYDPVRNRWNIDLVDLTDENKKLLNKERRTHKTHPVDVGDYHKRYGITRHPPKPDSSKIKRRKLANGII